MTILWIILSELSGENCPNIPPKQHQRYELINADELLQTEYMTHPGSGAA